MKSNISKLIKLPIILHKVIAIALVSVFLQSMAIAGSVTTSEQLSLRDLQIGMNPTQVKNIFAKKCSDPHSTTSSRKYIPRGYLSSGTEGLDFSLLGDTYVTCNQIQILDRVTRRFFMFFHEGKLDYIWISHFQTGGGGSSYQNHPPAYFEALGEKYNLTPKYTNVGKNNGGDPIIRAAIVGNNGDWLAVSGAARLDDKGNVVGYEDTVLEFGGQDFYKKVNARIKNIADEQEAAKRNKEAQNKSKL